MANETMTVSAALRRIKKIKGLIAERTARANAAVELDEGAGVARTSLWRTSTGAASAAPAGGLTYTVVTQTVFPDFAVYFSTQISINKVRFTTWSQMATGNASGLGSAYFLTFCVLPSTLAFIAPLATTLVLTACFVWHVHHRGGQGRRLSHSSRNGASALDTQEWPPPMETPR